MDRVLIIILYESYDEIIFTLNAENCQQSKTPDRINVREEEKKNIEQK